MTDDTDDQILDDLRRITRRRDTPPAHVREAARAALGWRAIDEELAELVADSLTEASSSTAVRSTSQPAAARTLCFEHDERGIEVEITAHDGRYRIVGQLLPPGPGRVEIRTGGAARPIGIDTDDLGRFDANGLPRGPLSLRATPDEGGPFTTAWVNI
jgi:hypothetical protein